MSMEEGVNQLMGIKENISNIMHDLITVPVFPTDYNREIFLFSELESLLAILNMKEQKRYKESFILVRTVFEKFLFFWLMFEGKKYRHAMTFNILRQSSKTDREARDSTLAKWKKLWSEGAEQFRQVISIVAGKKDSVIKVVYVFEGYQLIRNGTPTDEIVPVYNSILEEYKPDVAHLGKLSSMTGEPLVSQNSQVIEVQKTLYHNFFYIESIFRNLRLNKLIDSEQLNKIRVHYNFLSNYVHVAMANLAIWKDVTEYSNQKSYEDEIYDKLIFLYVAKLFHLYLKVYVNGYQDENNNPVVSAKYKHITEKLESLSKDLWFFDNEPTEYDVKNSEYLKQIRKTMEKTIMDDLLYYNDPLERMKMLISYRKQRN
jgi:hypothetical protein